MENNQVWKARLLGAYGQSIGDWLFASEFEAEVLCFQNGMISIEEISRLGAWMPDFSGGQFWTWAVWTGIDWTEAQFWAEVQAAWDLAGQPYPG